MQFSEKSNRSIFFFNSFFLLVFIKSKLVLRIQEVRINFMLVSHCSALCSVIRVGCSGYCTRVQLQESRCPSPKLCLETCVLRVVGSNNGHICLLCVTHCLKNCLAAWVTSSLSPSVDIKETIVCLEE